ncbi:hypothetical protein [Streptomyces roseochromogenus]|uniref:hypothetical protein n=1 Tax=Streptomyces roseochromogenus TaxID=285450 RepID=UPI0004CDE7C2|nr:hypothetical protein [Streptomyces roseochromogenus]
MTLPPPTATTLARTREGPVQLRCVGFSAATGEARVVLTVALAREQELLSRGGRMRALDEVPDRLIVLGSDSRAQLGCLIARPGTLDQEP